MVKKKAGALEIHVIVGGREIRLDRETVLRKIKDLRPGHIRTHAVRIDGALYAVKDVFAAASGLDPLDFNTNQARIWLRRLGFEPVRIKGGIAG